MKCELCGPPLVGVGPEPCDGKLTLSTEVGGCLNQYVSEKGLGELITYVEDVYIKFGAPLIRIWRRNCKGIG